jgi:peptidoglycan/LPS O-acetylase OafA/YrhL
VRFWNKLCTIVTGLQNKGIAFLYPTSQSAEYRPDIDGLRAFAVIAVVVFHAFPSHLKGGFIGVDVFFVISGFLITNIIHKGLKNNTFRFWDFWAKRIRRIFPALLVVIVSTLIAGWWYLLPAEFENLKSHVKWGLVFSSNFKLQSEVGYFDTASELKPLLHLWSLAIEEQFYLLWPAFLWICFHLRINLFVISILLALASYKSRKYFGISESGAFYYPWTCCLASWGQLKRFKVPLDLF